MADERTPREVREDFRADRGDAIMDRMDSICDKLTDKLEILTVSLTGVDVRLNNHLHHHEKLEKFLMYPLIVAFICGAAALIWTAVKSHF